MSKPIKKPNRIPTPTNPALPGAPIRPVNFPTTALKPQPEKETEEQKQARVAGANKALKALCEQYHVAFHVPQLDISSGKIWPIIQLMALDLP